MKKYWLPILVFAWASFQMGLTQFSDLSPWKLGGYGMYADFHPNTYFVWFQIDDKRIFARRTKLFAENAVFKKLVMVCRTHPSTSNLKKLHDYFKDDKNEHFKVEVWRLNFKSDSLKLGRVLVNSYED